MYFIGVSEGKIEHLKKEGKLRISILIFTYTVHFAYLKVYTKFYNTGSNRSFFLLLISETTTYDLYRYQSKHDKINIDHIYLVIN